MIPQQTRELLGRSAMTFFFMFCASLKATAVYDSFAGASWQTRDVIEVASGIAGLGFLLAIVVTTITRLPPQRSAAGIQPRVVALIGAFATTTFIALPPVEVSPGVELLADVIVLAGCALCILCLAWLGRSFSIMAQARQLVTAGPYRFARHPLYACEAVMLAGIILRNPSWLALTIASVALFFQYLRIRNEEAVLRSVFPEYASYALQTPMLLPGLAPRRKPTRELQPQ
ncbi:MAG: isoprenylcysteine carboxylmethyltransferase family protein [Gammaproteobacteria bacterium]|nr:isoprenylcysteine carboxylmethyltransferase family protein [Gammaproteobacteria bacterium]